MARAPAELEAKSPQPRAYSDHWDLFAAKGGSELVAAQNEGAPRFGDAYTLVREICSLPGRRSFHLDARTRARIRLADACPPGIDPIRWRQAIDAAGTLMAQVDVVGGPVITFPDAPDGPAAEGGA
jgi:hypothetical protein